MTGPMIISGILFFFVFSIGAAVIMAVAAWSDVHERIKQWALHRIWW